MGSLYLKKLCFKPCRDVSNIGNWPMTIYLCDRKTDRLTDRWKGRLGLLTWGSLYLKKLCFKPCRDVSYIGNWPMTIYLCDRETDRLTDRQTDRQTDIFCCARARRPHITVCRWSVSKLSVNCLKNVCFQCLTSRK